MAVKTFCDSCDKEIKKGDQVAQTTWIENSYTLLDGATSSSPQPVQLAKITCWECFKQIKKILDKNVKK